LLADALGFAVGESAGEALSLEDPRFHGYLSNVTPSEFDSEFRRILPDSLSGAAFLQRFSATTDAVTRVEPERTYPVRAASEHPIREHHRVRTFAELLGCAASERVFSLLGELMYQSHQSYTACGLGSEATDRLVELVREAGPAQGLYGAKITGGGSGGTVAVLARADAEASVSRIARRFSELTRRDVHIFSGSSAGAAEFGATVVPGLMLAPHV